MAVCSPGLSENMKLLLPPQTCELTSEVILQTSGNQHCSNRNTPSAFPRQNPGGLQSAWCAAGIAANKQVKGKTVAQRIKIRVEHIQHKSQESFLTRVKENDQTKEEAKERTTRSELKRQPAPGRAALWGPGERGLGHWDGSL